LGEEMSESQKCLYGSLSPVPDGPEPLGEQVFR
jgi:hypothetical protein